MEAERAIALRLGDSALVLGQQVGKWVSNSPTIELDIAFGNLSLDLIGQAQMFYDFVAEAEGKGRNADDLAYWRDAHEFFNFQLVEQPNGDFAQTMMRQFLFAVFAELVFEQMKNGQNEKLAAIAQKAQKEMRYHIRHAGEWVVRLGDGTQESHDRAQKALDFLWPWTHELFAYDAVDETLVGLHLLPARDDLKGQWFESVSQVFETAGLRPLDEGWAPVGSRTGLHSENLSYILQEMQVLARTHPGAVW